MSKIRGAEARLGVGYSYILKGERNPARACFGLEGGAGLIEGNEILDTWKVKLLAAVALFALANPGSPAAEESAAEPAEAAAEPAELAATVPAEAAPPESAPAPEAPAPEAPASEAPASEAPAVADSEEAAVHSPAAQVVIRLHETFLTVMKGAEALGYEGRRDLLAPVLTESFDLDFMGSKAAGKHWRSFDEAQQERWLDAFERLTVANYAGRFTGHSGQYFENLGEEPATHETLVVRTKLIDPEGDDVQLNYRLRETDGGWRAIDIYMHGTVSELALRRAEYTSAIERDGFEKVLADINGKADDLSANTAK